MYGILLKIAYIIAENIFHTLCKLDSANISYYKENLAKLESEIERTDREIRTYLQNTTCAFLIYHPALSYFARDYGLEQISIEEGGKGTFTRTFTGTYPTM